MSDDAADSAQFEKHRRGDTTLELSFASHLVADDEVAEVVSVIVARRDPQSSDRWVDHTAEFNPTTQIIDGGEAVEVDLQEASASGEQDPGLYTVLVLARTAEAEEDLARFPTLKVVAEGDVTFSG